MLSSEISLDQHCENIYRSRSIKNKIIVLCEGDIARVAGRASPQSYRQLQKYPDANFYQRCIPKMWQGKRPEFFNCGSCTQVIKTYFRLLELHQNQVITDSYLDVNKLFAIVDVDIQKITLDEDETYPFRDTDAIFCDLYQNARVNPENAPKHKIWVTGLVHKEAYFVVPELQEVFDNHPIKLQFAGEPLNLKKLSIQMAKDMAELNDLIQHFDSIKHRVAYCSEIPVNDLAEWQQTWLDLFSKADADTQNQLIYLLLAIMKAKDYWEKKFIPVEWNGASEQFREQLMLKIADFYAETTVTEHFHIPYFLKTIHNITYPSVD